MCTPLKAGNYFQKVALEIVDELNNRSGKGALMCICMQSIVPMVKGRTTIERNPLLTVTCYIRELYVFGHFVYEASRFIPFNRGSTQLMDASDIPTLSPNSL